MEPSKIELLSNGNSVKNDASKPPTEPSTTPSIPVTQSVFYSSFLKDGWDSTPNTTAKPNVPVAARQRQNSYNNDDNFFSSFNYRADAFPSIRQSFTPNSSPPTSSSSTSIGTISCGRCETNAVNRCLECKDILCNECTMFHRQIVSSKDHTIVKINNPNSSTSTVSYNPANYLVNLNTQCDAHNEILRYLCETCKSIVCQECTLWGHKDHKYVPLKDLGTGARDKINAILESGKLGTRYIKASIDRALAYSQAVERDANECTTRIKKAMRHFILVIEDRERVMLERVEKFRQQKLAALNDQMLGLREALAGLSQTSEQLNKALDTLNHQNSFEIASILINGELQMENVASVYKSLQEKHVEESLSFVAPNFDMLMELRAQGELILSSPKGQSVISTPIHNNGGGTSSRRASLKGVPTKVLSNWETVPNSNNTFSSLNASGIADGAIGQCIPGSTHPVVAKPATGASVTFGFEGHEDGQVSRPWGICTDKRGNILVADRRNNRVQIFDVKGVFVLKFGQKGTKDGEFDLPAGITTDPNNRICVVDKDNHRVQIFNSQGIFLKKFGSYGKENGQFQYPWDVAVNSKGEMLVTDSRNHRIQLFSSNGTFITRFSFDGVNHNRYLKGITTPRGVCFTPHGKIIVSDFENHRLLLIDSALTTVIAAKGHEGSGTHEFSRPSGICCDDEGRIIVADSKNQRVIVFSQHLEFLWATEIKQYNGQQVNGPEEKDRPSDVALLPDGRLVIMVETSPDSRDQPFKQKTFVHIY